MEVSQIGTNSLLDMPKVPKGKTALISTYKDAKLQRQTPDASTETVAYLPVRMCYC